MSIQSRFQSLPTVALREPPLKPQLQTHATLADRAWSVFTDLRYSAVVTADHRDPLDSTADLLHKSGVHMAFVTDTHGAIIGMVSAEHLRGERPLQRAMAAHVRHDELALEDLMTPVADWAVVDLGELSHARVGDIIETLKTTGQRYLFVTEQIGEEKGLRGLFSARRIELAVHTDLAGDGQAHSFAELGAVIGR